MQIMDQIFTFCIPCMHHGIHLQLLNNTILGLATLKSEMPNLLQPNLTTRKTLKFSNTNPCHLMFVKEVLRVQNVILDLLKKLLKDYNLGN
ncbi:hypothetical protein DBT52_09410 [Aerococcus mictus]|nr:hypothetical protein DBT52_09410 [Aerococcus mictus]